VEIGDFKLDHEGYFLRGRLAGTNKKAIGDKRGWLSSVKNVINSSELQCTGDPGARQWGLVWGRRAQLRTASHCVTRRLWDVSRGLVFRGRFASEMSIGRSNQPCIRSFQITYFRNCCCCIGELPNPGQTLVEFYGVRRCSWRQPL
jgi:hypothetical protein